MRPEPGRSLRTRERITAAARRLFAERGYERTTVRAVAEAAAIDPSMVMRYFGSKEGLFAAVAEFDLRLPDPGRIDRERLGEQLVRHFLERWEHAADDGLIVLLRSAVSNEMARRRMLDIFTGQVHPFIRCLCNDAPDASMRSELVASQLLGLAFCRLVLRLPRLSAGDTEPIVTHVGAAVQGYLQQ